MSSIVEISSRVSTPLALAGIIGAFLYLIYRQIIARNIFPKLTKALSGAIIQNIINKLFILALVAMFLGFTAYLVNVFAGSSKPPDSAAVTIPSGMSLQNAVKAISANDNHTVVFDGCDDAFLNAEIESGTITAATSKELIEVLQHRVINPPKKQKYNVDYFKDRGIYEIHCHD